MKKKAPDMTDAPESAEGARVKPKKEKLSKSDRAEYSAEMKRLKGERKKLRRDLKKNGMKQYADFELFAKDMGLSYPEGSREAQMSKTLVRLTSWLRVTTSGFGIVKLLIAAAAILAIVFLIAYITEEKGHFTINLTADMMREGFVLSETEEDVGDNTRLFATEIVNCNATSIYEITRKVNQIDGDHNGPGYMAYTFYLTNAGEETTNYGYTVNILSETLNTASAAWVMFFEDDKQIIYAQAQPNGKPEELYGYPDSPFIESAYYPDEQYYTENGMAGIITTPFIDAETVLQGYVEDFEPGATKKYTVVVWTEGDDPDCNNSILGGHVGFNVIFERLGNDEEGYFKGLFREEYDKSFNAEKVDDTEHTHEEHTAHTSEDASAARSTSDEVG